MKQPLIEINNWSGGMTLNERMGKENQFHIGKNVDFSTKPGTVTCGVNWKQMAYSSSSDLPTSFDDMITTSNHQIYFGGEDGKIYKRSDADDISLAHSSTESGAINELAEYQDYLYYTQTTTIGRYDLSTTWTDNWQTGLNSGEHPIKVSSDGIMYIGNGQYLASWDNSTFTANALDLPSDWKIKCLEDFGTLYLAIGASKVDSSGQPIESRIFLWNKADSSWNDEIIVPENDIHTMKFSAGYLWIWAGESANIYVVPSGSRMATKMWSFTKESQHNLKVYRNAVISRRGTIYFGLSDLIPYTDYNYDAHPNNPTGIYSFPADPNRWSLNILYRLYDKVERYKSLVQYYVDNTKNVLHFNVYHYNPAASEWKSYLVREKLFFNENMYDGTTEVESFTYDAPIGKKMVTEYFGIECEPLPSSCTISLSYKKDNDSNWTTLFNNFQTNNATEKKKLHRIQAKSLKLKLILTGGDKINRPFIKRVYVTGHPINA